MTVQSKKRIYPVSGMKKILFFLVLLTSIGSLAAQPKPTPTNDTPEFIDHFYTNVRDYIRIPDIPGYLTLKCDLHIHSAYSDGSVWPSVRVDEAWSEGLDAIAITEHIEYRPNNQNGLLQGDHNQAYRIAKAQGDRMGILVIPGGEISRYKPLGHLNAFFLQDANALNVQDSLKAIDIAIRQGAFIMWNHPGWPDRQVTMYEEHEKLLREHKIHGIELINGPEYHPRAIAWCREYDLAYLCGSDAHGLIVTKYGTARMPRPMTLVFAKERSIEGLKEAMFARRTAVVFHDLLIGPAQYLGALVKASLRSTPVSRDESRKISTLDILNDSDISFKTVVNELPVILHAGRITRITLPGSQTELEFTNCLITENEFLSMPVSFLQGN